MQCVNTTGLNKSEHFSIELTAVTSVEDSEQRRRSASAYFDFLVGNEGTESRLQLELSKQPKFFSEKELDLKVSTDCGTTRCVVNLTGVNNEFRQFIQFHYQVIKNCVTFPGLHETS